MVLIVWVREFRGYVLSLFFTLFQFLTNSCRTIPTTTTLQTLNVYNLYLHYNNHHIVHDVFHNLQPTQVFYGQLKPRRDGTRDSGRKTLTDFLNINTDNRQTSLLFKSEWVSFSSSLKIVCGLCYDFSNICACVNWTSFASYVFLPCSSSQWAHVKSKA